MADGHVETVDKPEVAFQTQGALNEKVESVLENFWNAENAEQANLFTHPNSAMFLSNKEFKKYKKSYDTYCANDLYRKVQSEKEYCC